MEPLKLENSDDTPQVILDKAKNIFEMSGRCLPEDAVSFFNPIMDWIKHYTQSPNPTTDFHIKLDYFNTASSKLLLDLLTALKPIPAIRVIWHSYADDEEVQEAGVEFSEQVDIPFEFRER
jgi:SiaC family regulatory phosphoprotein